MNAQQPTNSFNEWWKLNGVAQCDVDFSRDVFVQLRNNARSAWQAGYTAGTAREPYCGACKHSVRLHSGIAGREAEGLFCPVLDDKQNVIGISKHNVFTLVI